MKLTFLGTGTSHGLPYIGCECAVCTSSDPFNKRTRSSVLIANETTGENASVRLLIDTTPDLRAQFLRENIVRVDAVIWTHTHNDHIIGLDDLRPVTDICGYIPTYASAATMAHLQNIFGYAFVQNRDHAGFPRLIPNTIESHAPFEIAGFQITPIPILHGKNEIFAYRFERAGSTLVYATDCSHIPDTSWELMQNPDVFIVDALRWRAHPTHFNIEQALFAAQKIGAKRTFFTHIAHDLDHHETQNALPENVWMSYDGLQITL